MFGDTVMPQTREPRDVVVTVNASSRIFLSWDRPEDTSSRDDSWISWAKPTEDQPEVGLASVSSGSASRVDGVIHLPEVPPTFEGDLAALENLVRKADRHGVGRGIVVQSVWDAYTQKHQSEAVQVYGRKGGAYVVSNGEIFHMLLAQHVIAIRAPQKFYRNRTGGRLCVLRSGEEVPLLHLCANYLKVEAPTWEGSCWTETLDNIVSMVNKPLGGTNAYAKEYYARTASAKRKAVRDREKAIKEAAEAALRPPDPLDEILASLQRDGGGGPRHSESERRTLYGRDVPRDGSGE